MDNQDKFEAGSFYHIYNRAVGNDKIFFTEYNYSYLLSHFTKYLSVYLDVYSYCLLPNHYHFMVGVKPSIEGAEEKITEAYRQVAISYAMSINKQQGRKGSLFTRPFKRKVIQHDSHFTSVIAYIHLNPVHHGLVKDHSTFKWSSYRSMLSKAPTRLKRDAVLEWFGGLDKFISFHAEYQTVSMLED